MTRRDLQIPGLDPNATYAVQIRGIDADGIPGSWSSQFQFVTSNDTMPPKQPQNLSIEIEGSNFMLSWDAVETNEDDTDIDDLRDYVVKISAGAQTERFTTVDNKYAFTISRNKTAFGTAQPSISVTVVARDRVGNESVEATAPAIKPPPVASALVATAKRNGVELQWTNEGEDLDRFEIWKNDVKYAEVGGDTFIWTDTDVGEGAQTYYIKSVDRFEQAADSNTATEGEISLDIDSDTIAPKPPTNPAGISEETGPNQANALVSWDAPVQDVDDTSYTDQEGFEVRYRTDAGRPWNYFRVPDLRADGTTPENVQAEIEQLPAGATLSWQVRAFDRSYNYSDWLADTLALAADTVPPAAPIGVVASGGIRTVTVQWDRNAEDDLAGYRLYASQTAAFTPDPTNLVFEGLGTAVSFSTGDGETWYVRVTAIDHAGNESAASPEESATTLNLGGGDDTPPADVTNVLAASTTYYHGSTEASRIAVSWDAVADTDLGAYIVSWRRAAGDWSEEQVGSGSTTFLLTGAEPGVQYDFRIKAVDTSGNLSVNWSNVASETPVSTDGDIQQEVAIGSGGAVQSSDFDPLVPRGYRLDNDSLEIYGDGTHGVSLVLGGSAGLNMNTLNDELWFGAALFADANWRVDGLGNMRVGGAGAFYADQGGNIWSGNAAMASAPWEITAAGAARFNNIRITGDDLADNEFLIVAGNDFSMQKLVGGGFETRLAGDFIVEAGGDININGGSLRLTSGDITMNGGTLSLAGGAVSFDGAPVSINGSDFTVNSGTVIVASGSATAPALRSNDYDYANKTGWGFDNGNLYLFDGEIEASLITLQQGANLVDHGYAQFSYEPEWYDKNISTSSSSGFVASLTSIWSRYGGASLRLQNSSGAGVYTRFAPTSEDYNIVLEEDVYIISCYAHNNGAANADVRIGWRRDSGTNNLGPTETLAPGEARRIFTSLSAVADGERVLAHVYMPGDGDISIDGFQIEKRVGSNTEPSFFKVGGVTSLAGGQITTGVMKSENFSAGTSGWRINWDGNVEFEQGVFRGDIFATGGEIDGSLLVEGTVTTKQLVVGNFDNLVQNPGAESGSIFPHVIIDGRGTWSAIDAAVEPTVVRSGQYAFFYDPVGHTSGSSVIYLNGAAGDVNNQVQCSEGDEFTMAVWARPSGPTSDGWNRSRMILQWRRADGSYISGTQDWIHAPAGETTHNYAYQRYSLTGVAPAETAFVAATIYVEPDGRAGQWAYDDMYMRRNIDAAIFAGDLRSDNYIEGVSGWRIRRDTGDVEFEDGIFRGDIDGSDITGATITGSTLSTGFSGERVVIQGNGSSVEFFTGVSPEAAPGLISSSAYFSGASGDTGGVTIIAPDIGGGRATMQVGTEDSSNHFAMYGGYMRVGVDNTWINGDVEITGDLEVYEINPRNSTSLRIQTASGYGLFGARDTGFFHVDTDRSAFYSYAPWNIGNLDIRTQLNIPYGSEISFDSQYAPRVPIFMNGYNMEFRPGGNDYGLVDFIFGRSGSGGGRIISHGTWNNTGGSANLHISSSGMLFRATSSRKYKTDIRPIEMHEAEKILSAEPVRYRGIGSGQNGKLTYYGFIAEQIRDDVDVRLVDYQVDDEGEIILEEAEGVHYSHIIPMHNVLIKDVRSRVEELEAQVAEQNDRIAALEAAMA